MYTEFRTCMTSSFVYPWIGMNYLIQAQWDVVSLQAGEDTAELETLSALFLYALADGRVQEEVLLYFDPTANWIVEYDPDGRLAALQSGSPETRQVQWAAFAMPSFSSLQPPAPDGPQTPSWIPQDLVNLLREHLSHDTEEELAAFLNPMHVEHILTEEEIAVLPQHILEDNSGYDVIDYNAVDFDNDGLEDLYVYRREGMGRMARWLEQCYCGDGRGDYHLEYYTDSYMTGALFLCWNGQNYRLEAQYDFLGKPGPTGGADFMPLYGLRLICYQEGWPCESVYVYYLDSPYQSCIDHWGIAGDLASVESPQPEGRQVGVQIDTRGINTDFPLPHW